MYTRFFDMSSGGKEKLKWKVIYIELPEKEAKEYFQNKFNRDPENITCNCCGEDYSIYEESEVDSDADLVITKEQIDGERNESRN